MRNCSLSIPVCAQTRASFKNIFQKIGIRIFNPIENADWHSDENNRNMSLRVEWHLAYQ